MALKMDYVEVYRGKELFFENAYYQTVSVLMTKEYVNARVVIYANEQKKEKLTERNYSYTPDLDGSSVNAIKETYLHLKSLPEFADSIDC